MSNDRYEKIRATLAAGNARLREELKCVEQKVKA